MTARHAADFPSGQEYAGVPPAATSAAPIHLEQEHEDHHRREARDHLGPRHHLGPLTPMSPLNLTVHGTDTPERGKFSRLPDVGRVGVRRTRRPSPHPVGRLSLAASARRPAQAGLTVRAALAGHPRAVGPVPRAANAAPSPPPGHPDRPRPGARHDVTNPAAVKIPSRRDGPHDLHGAGPGRGRADGARRPTKRRGGEPISAIGSSPP